MTRYNHTNKGLKPHQQANTAGSDANLTAIKRQDSRQVNCGGNDSCNWCEIDPDCPYHAGDGENSDTSMEVNVSFGINFLDWMVIILLVVFLVNSCLPAHAVTNSTFETRLPTTNATSLQATSPYYQGIEKNRTPKRNFALLIKSMTYHPVRTHEYGKSNFGLTIKSSPYQGIEKNTTKQVEQQVERLIQLQNNFTKLNTQIPSNDRQMKNPLTDVKSWGYDGVLTKTHVSGQTKPSSFGFFVPKICLDSQSSKRLSTIHFTQYLSSQGKTVISMVSNLPTSYDGMTLQNKRAFGRICRAVADVTESESHHLMNTHNVLLTQKHTSGGLYHA